ncbi:MAG: aldo/keto reductase [Nitrososphaerales archaeon]
MRYKNLGKSGLKVSELILGTWFLPTLPEVDEYGVRKVDEEMSIKIMKKAVDLGINCIDTADRYHGAIAPIPLTHVGNVEKIIGKFLKEVDRESLIIATKVKFPMGSSPNDEGLSRKHIMKAVRDSMNRLGVSYIDLYQAHGFDPSTPLRESLRAFNDLIRWGLVHYIGCSNFPSWAISESLMISEKEGLDSFISVQPPYNLLNRDIEKDLIPLSREKGLGIICYSPLAQGMLTGKYSKDKPITATRAEYSQFMKDLLTDRNFRIVDELKLMASEKGIKLSQLALAWILSNPDITAPIIGVTSLEQLEDNVRATEIKLSADDLKRIDEITLKG